MWLRIKLSLLMAKVARGKRKEDKSKRNIRRKGVEGEKAESKFGFRSYV